VVDVQRLLAACGDEGRDAGITIRSELEPLAGPGTPVKPAVYAGGVYQMDRRWWGDAGDRRPVDVVVVDNVPSQANRLEAALRGLRERLGLPEIVLDFGAVGPLPPHLPSSLSSFQFPHRQADAYLRDSMLDGKKFEDTEIGSRIFAATVDDPGALLEWFPQALLFGFWQSHLGKKRSHAKLARSWVSEIVGYDPATVETRQFGLKGDPLNLSVDEAIVYDENDTSIWELAGAAKSSAGKRERLSEIGHGQVPVSGSDAALAGVSFAMIEQRSTVSFASLRRLHLDTPEQSTAARALLAALGIVAHAAAFGRPFSLRSGCELRNSSVSWTWLGATSDESIEVLDVDSASELFESLVAEGERAGLPVGTRWSAEPLVLEPLDALVKVIRETYPLES
jgi:CRISPR-associated protein Csb1